MILLTAYMKRFDANPLLFLYVGYALIATLQPFEFSSDPSKSISKFLAEFLDPIPGGIAQLGRKDFMSNVLLFFPAGILFCSQFIPTQKRKTTSVLLASVFGTLLSILIEVSQVFFAGRHPSAADVFANSLGTILGAVLFATYSVPVTNLFRPLGAKVKSSRFSFVAVLLFGSLPLVLSITQYPWINFHNWDPNFTFQIGNEATLGRAWLGKIYLAAIYKWALPSEEITSLFQSGPSREASSNSLHEGLIAFYNFREGSGQTVHDVSRAGTPLDLILSPVSGVRWLKASNGIEFVQPGIFKSQGPARKLFDALTETNELTIEVWVSPENIQQEDAARIISFSRDPEASNFTLGQYHEKILFRLRSPTSGKDGDAVCLMTKHRFLTCATFHLVATYKNGTERLFINGREHGSMDLRTDAIVGLAAVGLEARKTLGSQFAYSFVFFFPVSVLAAATLWARSKKPVISLLLSAATGTCLLIITEMLQAFAVSRDFDLSQIACGLVVIAAGCLSGADFAQGNR